MQIIFLRHPSKGTIGFHSEQENAKRGMKIQKILNEVLEKVYISEE